MEDKNIEYKADMPKKKNSLKAEIVSFLNTEGGEIYLGVDDNFNILKDKIPLYSDWEELISNWIFNAFSVNLNGLVTTYPKETPFRIDIKEGAEKPYYYKEAEGFNSKGIYIRVGSTKRVASYEEIRRMMLISKSHEYERLDSPIDKLTFYYASQKFEREGLIFDENGLMLHARNGAYNNAALLLSDQNQTVTKFAVFQGLNVDIFLAKREFKGSIIEQLDNVLNFVSIANKKKVVITGKPQRDEYLDYPTIALREAIVNCYCHRDWTLSGDIKIEFFDDRVSIYSPGSLPDGLTLKNILDGITAKRNPIIVNALSKSKFIENYASGIRRILNEYKNFEKKPEFNVSSNGIIVTLYNKNYTKSKEGDFQNIGDKDYKLNGKLTPYQRQVIVFNILSIEPNITREELADKLLVNVKTVSRDLDKLKENKLIEYIGGSKDGYWSTIK